MRRRPLMLESTERIAISGRKLKVILERHGNESVQEFDIRPNSSAILTHRKHWERTLAGEDDEVTETVICLIASDGGRVYFGGRMDPYERHKLRDRINDHLGSLKSDLD